MPTDPSRSAYVEARKVWLAWMRRTLMGPWGGDEEEIDRSPLDLYCAGILAPAGFEPDPERDALFHSGRDPGADEPACLYYYRWSGTAGKFTRHTISPPGAGVGTGMQICVADLNDDGRPDIAVSGKSGTWLLVNEGM